MSAEKTTSTKSRVLVPVYVVAAIALFVLVLIFPQSREVFKTLSGGHPFLMGFAKFALLATAGELLGGRISGGKWVVPSYVVARFAIWGVIGIWITYMMKMFGAGVAALMANGLLPGGSNAFLRALFISMTMNICFGPTFMAVHKCSDTYLALRAAKKEHSLKAVMNTVDWHQFVSFTILKTIPIFWIPAHTVTFLLPEEYQVVMAAALSVALGVILNLKKKSKA